jgi:hypothetical protein
VSNSAKYMYRNNTEWSSAEANWNLIGTADQVSSAPASLCPSIDATNRKWVGR